MYFRNLLLVCLLAFTAYSTTAKQVSFTCAGSTIILLDSAHAAHANSHADAYTRELTPFDVEIRLNKATGVTMADYLKTAAAEVRNWPAAEQQQLHTAFATIDSFAKATGLKLHLPDTVIMIKTNGREEFSAEGYTRGNRIMLNTSAQPIDLHLVAHELWHVISRNDKQARNAAYAVFHFKPCNNIIYKPAMHDKVITNPDCPYLMHYVTVQVNGAPQDVALMLYSKSNFHEGNSLGDYIAIGLLGLAGDDAHKKPLIKDGKPVIYELQDVPDLFNQIGKNTQYVLHPEEICAEHFAALIGGTKLPQMEYVEEMRKVLE